MADTYPQTRERLETYFDHTAAETWAQLTSDVPVSKIRQAVRAGRDDMQTTLLASLPQDLSGKRVLDAGCGVGKLSAEIAKRGAKVVRVDISTRLSAFANQRLAPSLRSSRAFKVGDMLDAGLGRFDYVVAMDSLIHYPLADIALALEALHAQTSGAVVFTVTPKTTLLMALHLAGKVLPRADRSPAIIPQDIPRLRKELQLLPSMTKAVLTDIGGVSTGFYQSHAMELR